MWKIKFKSLICRLLKRILIFSIILYVGLFINVRIPVFRFVYEAIFWLFHNTFFNVRNDHVILGLFCVWCEFVIVSIPFVLLLEFIEQSYVFLEKLSEKFSRK